VLLRPELSPQPGQDGAGAAEGRYRRSRDAWERRFFEDLLREADGSVGKAAELAGIHRSTLYEKLTRYGLVEKEDKA
jgi:two-component system response regulator HydG